ncbi:MAG: MgtC/SapB family protein [Clostridia bacterium]|nr:MgtC/SapB family protein [Clostridia bacterium]
MWEEVLNELFYLVNVLVAVLLGFAIGFERKLRYKEAGIRTHTIVCVGSALMMVVSKYAFSGTEADGARVAAQIVSGIGFLGAGIIMFRGQKMHGLTTAAGIWATAGVGMAAGAGMYVVATGATVILIAVQCICHIKRRPFSSKAFYQIKIVFRNDNDESVKIKELFAVDRLKSLSIVREGESRVFKATLNTDKEYSSQKLDVIMLENPFIISLERTDDI